MTPSTITVKLIRQTQAALSPNARIILLAALAADACYPIGFMHHSRAWMIVARDALADAV